jgi:ATP-binding cassette subfamily B protein
VIDGHVRPGNAVTVLLFGCVLVASLEQCLRTFAEWREGGAAGGRVSAGPEAPSEETNADRERHGALGFHGVSSRRSGSGGLDLDDVSFSVLRGEVVAIEDHEGSGLRALARLLRGDGAPDAGTIRFDGIDLAALNDESRARTLAIADGAAALAGRTVEEAIAAGRVATTGAIAAAARMAGVGEFLRYLPEGLESRVDDPRAQLSAGQRRRILLAQALLGAPPVLVLVDMFEGIDADSRRFIWQALGEGTWTRATLILAREGELPGTADRCLELEAGRLRAT